MEIQHDRAGSRLAGNSALLPYKQERLGHIVRLLAPLPEHIEKTAAPHVADPTRVPGRDFSSRNNHRARKESGAIKLFGKILFKLPALRKA